MSKERIPVWLDGLMKKASQQERQELFELYQSLKKHKLIKAMVSHSEKELERMTIEDERDDFLSKFTTQSRRAKRLGERKQLRQLVKNFK